MFGRLQQAARAYPFGRFLAKRWWTLAFVLAKARLATRDGYIPTWVMFGVLAVILGGWYLIVLATLRPEDVK